jgi:hypothetical protein
MYTVYKNYPRQSTSFPASLSVRYQVSAAADGPAAGDEKRRGLADRQEETAACRQGGDGRAEYMII